MFSISVAATVACGGTGGEETVSGSGALGAGEQADDGQQKAPADAPPAPAGDPTAVVDGALVGLFILDTTSRFYGIRVTANDQGAITFDIAGVNKMDGVRFRQRGLVARLVTTPDKPGTIEYLWSKDQATSSCGIQLAPGGADSIDADPTVVCPNMKLQPGTFQRRSDVCLDFGGEARLALVNTDVARCADPL
jgi:hypothetical protein